MQKKIQITSHGAVTAPVDMRVTAWDSYADEKSGELSLIRLKFARSPAADVLSAEHPPFVAEFFRGEGRNKISVGLIVLPQQKREFIWIVTKRVDPAELANRARNLPAPIPENIRELGRGKTVLVEVSVGYGERILANVEQVFLFACLPLGIGELTDEQAKWNGLEAWVKDRVEGEKTAEVEKCKAEGEARAAKQLKSFPRRLEHEAEATDHYKNRNEAVDKLLRREWPQLFKELDNLKLAKTNEEKMDCRKRILIGYAADYKALHGRYPAVKQEEAAEFARDDDYIRLMNEAMEGANDRVTKTDWQLVKGWIEKDYYRMNEKQLEDAFNPNWNYPPGKHKGNTLARRARVNLGLKSALKRGRKS